MHINKNRVPSTVCYNITLHMQAKKAVGQIQPWAINSIIAKPYVFRNGTPSNDNCLLKQLSTRRRQARFVMKTCEMKTRKQTYSGHMCQTAKKRRQQRWMLPWLRNQPLIVPSTVPKADKGTRRPQAAKGHALRLRGCMKGTDCNNCQQDSLWRRTSCKMETRK